MTVSLVNYSVSNQFGIIPNESKAESDQSKLLCAVAKKDLEYVRKNLPNLPKETINTVIDNQLLLARAIQNNDISMLSYLIQQGARLDIRDGESKSPLDYAISSSQANEILPMIIKEYSLINKEQIEAYLQDPAFMLLVEQSASDILERIKGRDPTYRPELHAEMASNLKKWYSTNNPIEKSEALNKLSQMVNSSLNIFGDTFLHGIVCDERSLDLLEALLKNGADPNIKNSQGQTPMHVACAFQTQRSIQLLAAHQGDLLQKDYRQITPIALLLFQQIKKKPSEQKTPIKQNKPVEQKDPLKLEASVPILAAFVTCSYLSQYTLNSEMSSYLIGGLATFSDLMTYGTIFSEFLVMVQQESAHKTLGIGLGLVSRYVMSYGEIPPLQYVLNLFILHRIKIVAFSAFQGVKTAWQNRKLQPYKSLRNGIVHAINLSYMTHQGVKVINFVMTYTWQFYLNSWSLPELSKQVEVLEQSKSSVLQDIADVDKQLKYKGCNKVNNLAKKVCTVLTEKKEHDLTLLDSVNKKIKILHEDVDEFFKAHGKHPLSVLWEKLTVTDPVQQAKNLLSINEDLFKENPKLAIEKAFRSYSLKWHPDHCKEKNICSEKMIEGVNAKEFLFVKLAL